MTNQSNDNPFDDAQVIYRYTRAQAIEDGVLIDLSEWARETGFRFPIACTAAVWHQHIVPPTAVDGCGQSERGRCHDLLWLLYLAIRRNGQSDLLWFDVLFLVEPDKHETVRLKAHCGPGDQGEPAITVMLPDED